MKALVYACYGANPSCTRLAACLTVALAAVAATARADEPAKTIRGVVVAADGGKPAAGAEVVLLDPPPNGQNVYYGKLPLRKVASGADGAFAFDVTRPGRYQVWANQGRLTSRTGRLRGLAVVVPDSRESPKAVELKLSPAVTVTAKVKDKATGKPIVGATLHLGWSDFRDDATTNADGVALLQPLTPEKWLVEAWADEYAKSSQWLSLESGADAEADFALVPGGDLIGIVRDAKGEPVAGAGLSAFAEKGYEQLQYVETGKDGRYRLRHLPRGVPLRVTASKKEYLNQEVAATLDRAEQTSDLTIRPRPHGGSIAGVVVDAQGKPIAGAKLSNSGNSSNDVREGETGPDGRFRMENLYENHMGKEVLVRAKGQAPTRLKVEPGTADKPSEMTITMEPGHRVRGLVVDDKGHPLEGVRVDFSHGFNAFSDGGTTTTDKLGQFSFDSLPADCPFGFQKEGYSQVQDRKLALDGEEVVRVEMIPAGAIVGRVVDAKTGKPVRSFNVRITFSPKRQPGDPSAGLLSSLSKPGQNYQSEEGKFRLGDLVAEMPLQVMIAAEGYERHVAERIVASRSDAPRNEEFAIDPIDPASLRTYSGRLIDHAGKPISEAQVRLIAARNRNEQPRGSFPFNWQMIRTGQIAEAAGVTRFLEAATDKQGRFAFAKVPKDDAVELIYWGKGIPAGRADELHLREDDAKKAIEIAVPAPGRITGVIDRKAFGPVARVSIGDVNGLASIDDLELKPGQEDFEVGDLPAGEYHVSLQSPFERVPGGGGGLTSRTVATGKVTVQEGGTSRVEFR